MAKGRMLQNRISKSKKMAGLSSDTVRLLYTWMLSHLDINGNFYADPVMVNNLVFTRLGHSVKTISSAIDELSANGLIVVYQVNGERYLKYPDFSDKQPSLYPTKEGTPEIPNLTDSSLIIESKVKESKEGFITTEKLLKSNYVVNKELIKERQESFVLFYKSYPKKMNKKDALDRWLRAELPEISIILSAIERHKKSEQWQKDEGKFIPYPSTWINQERWNDEVDTGIVKKKNTDIFICSKCNRKLPIIQRWEKTGSESTCKECSLKDRRQLGEK